MLDDGEWDGLILAAAGLRRLGQADRISAYFPARRLVPAAGQGALAIEIREGKQRMMELLAPLNDGPTAAAVAAERNFVRTVAVGCSIPLGVATSYMNNTLELWVRAVAPVPGPDAPRPIQDLQLTLVPEVEPYGDLTWAEDLGRAVGERFLERGGDRLIAAVPSLQGH